jgi:sugar phosphate isomerase/epimerase
MYETRSSRRSFLRGSVAGGAFLGLSLPLGPAPKSCADLSGAFKISLAEWSLHKALFAGEITNLDFPKIAREQYGIEGVEFVNQFFSEKAHDSVYLRDLKKGASDHGVTCVLIMVDGEGDMSEPEKRRRYRSVENHRKWVHAAAALGCHSIRINTGEHYSTSDVGGVAEACSLLTEYGAQHKIGVICENHGGPSSNPDALIALMKAVNNPNFGTLPDFGNFPKGAEGKYAIDIYDAVERMMPYAKGVSAKSYDFDHQGKETTLDYARLMKIVAKAGYHGFVGIEYEGGRLSEPEGIRATKKLLESLRARRGERAHTTGNSDV